MPGDLPRLDHGNQCLWRGSQRIDLAPKEFQLLSYLSARPDRLVTRSELLEQVWSGTHVSDAVLSVAMAQVRELLGDDPRKPEFIQTIHRRGYRWIAKASFTSSESQPASDDSDVLLVGRSRELAQLQDALERARRGERQLLFVTGEAGIGKTALVDAFVSSLIVRDSSFAKNAATPKTPASDAFIARGQCLEHFGAGEAYLPFIDALGRLVRRPAAADLVAVLRRHAPTWFVQLPWLLTQEDRQQLRQELAGGTRERMLRELAAAIEAFTAKQLLVMVLEDLHWSDPSTITLLSMLAQRREAARFLLVGTFRPVDALLAAHPINDLKRQTVGRRIAQEIALPLLGTTDVSLYLGRRFSAAIADSLAAGVHDRTEGNPLFVMNILDHLLSRQFLFDRDGSWALATQTVDLGETPESLRQAIEQQVEHLGPEDTSLLEAASIIGREFTLAALATASAGNELDVHSRCESLSRRGAFLKAKASAAPTSPAYEFAHALYQTVLYERQAPARRMQGHRRIADWLAEHGDNPVELLHHLVRADVAGDRSRLVDYARRAAERARAVFAFDEAISHYDTALQRLAIAGDEMERCTLMIGLAEAQERAGRIAAANDTFLKAAALGRSLGDAGLLARAALGLGRAYQQVGQVNHELIELLEEAALRLAPTDKEMRARVLARLTWALCALPGSANRRQQLSEEAIALARELEDPGTFIWVRQYTQWAFAPWQSVDDLRATAGELAALCARVRDKEQLLMLRLLRVTDLLEIGDVEEGDVELAALAALVEETQIPWFCWYLRRIETVRALLEGRLDDAERLATAAVEAAEGMDHPNVLPLFAAQTMMLRWQQGRAAEIEPLVREYVKQNPNVYAWRALHACLLCELERREDAELVFATLAAHDFGDIPQDSVWLNTLAMLAIACAYLGDRKRAEVLDPLLQPYADRCIGIASSTFALGHATRYLALLAATRGRSKEARQLFRRGIAANTRLRAAPWAEATQRDFDRFRDQGKAR